MRRFLLACSLIVSGSITLVVLAFSRPLLAVLRTDRRERQLDEVDRWLPYDDNDPGIDVDGDPDEQLCESCALPFCECADDPDLLGHGGEA